MTTVNKYRFNIKQNDRYLNIPIEIKTDMLGRDDLVDKYEEEVLQEVINPIEDFEVTRYAHKDWVKDNEIQSSIEYEFYFYNRNTDIVNETSTSTSIYVNDYKFTENPNFSGECFTDAEIYYGTNAFKRSFFKLDLYDTPDSETQQLYLSIIIPTQQGKTRSSDTDPIISNPQINGPTIPVVVPGGGFDTGLSVIVEDENQSLEIDSNMIFNDSYKATFTNCNSFTLDLYLEVNMYLNEMLPSLMAGNSFSINWQNTTCYEFTSVDTQVVIPDPPLYTYIDDINTFDTNDCGCAPPTPTPTPSSSGLPPPAPPWPPGPSPSVTPTPSISTQTIGTGGDINNNPQGFGQGEDSSPIVAPPNVQIRKPNFLLDFIGDKEGYFIYWLKNPNYIDIDTFYMGAKFFNAKTGQFSRFLNQRQTSLSERFTFDKSKFFYYKVQLDTDNYVYEVLDTDTNQRVGTNAEIKWYEYMNPS